MATNTSNVRPKKVRGEDRVREREREKKIRQDRYICVYRVQIV